MLSFSPITHGGWALLLVTIMSAQTAQAEEGPEPNAGKTAGTAGPANVVMPTFGGMQFWSDVQFFHQWHIQRNVFTGHYRLLDEKDRRHAWGTLDQCRVKLDQIKAVQALPPMTGKAVIVLHGLIRTRNSMNALCSYLRDEGRYTVINVNYPSTRAEVGEHARDLASIVEHLEGIDEINIVTHSLGSLIIRHFLADQRPAPLQARRASECIAPDALACASGLYSDQPAADGTRSVPATLARLNRIVMLAPPNQGAELAEKLGRNQVFKAVFGPTGAQMARDWPELEKKLAIPSCEFGIIAGGRGDNHGWNPLLSGDDDMVVSVETTKLPGAADFAVLPLQHTFMMNDATLQQYVRTFLQHGYFVSKEKRQAIDAEATSP